MRGIAWLWVAQIYEVSDVSLTRFQLSYEIEIAFGLRSRIESLIVQEK